MYAYDSNNIIGDEIALKRFVTYLYEYKSGQKTRNTGFIRVDIRNDKVSIELCVKNVACSWGTGIVYAFIKEEELLGIELGETMGINGQSNTRFVLNSNDINGSGCSIECICGIGIRFSNQLYMASCWKDDILEEIGNYHFSVFKKEDEDIQAAAIEEKEMIEDCDIKNDKEEASFDVIENEQELDSVTYKKIALNEIRALPSRNWHLCNNSFLLHGFLNYGYLILKKESGRFFLGVPGFFEKPEMMMAMVYGFPNFEGIPKDIIELPMHIESVPYKIEKNQKPETGVFGIWLVSV